MKIHIEQVTIENELLLLFLIRHRSLLNHHHRNCHRTLINTARFENRPKQGRRCDATQVLCCDVCTLLTLLSRGCCHGGSNLYSPGKKRSSNRSMVTLWLKFSCTGSCFTLTQYRNPRSPHAAGGDVTLPVQEEFVEVIQLIYDKVVRRVDALRSTGTLHGDSRKRIVMTGGEFLKRDKLQAVSKIHLNSGRGPRRNMGPS